MEVLVTKPFIRFQKKERIEDRVLVDAVARAQVGLIDADLGGGLIKQRVARAGQGKSGGYRTIIAYRTGSRAVFLYGFAKNERENIDADELAAWRDIGASWLAAGDPAVEQAIAEERAKRVDYDDEDKNKGDG